MSLIFSPNVLLFLFLHSTRKLRFHSRKKSRFYQTPSRILSFRRFAVISTCFEAIVCRYRAKRAAKFAVCPTLIIRREIREPFVIIEKPVGFQAGLRDLNHFMPFMNHECTLEKGKEKRGLNDLRRRTDIYWSSEMSKWAKKAPTVGPLQCRPYSQVQ